MKQDKSCKQGKEGEIDEDGKVQPSSEPFSDFIKKAKHTVNKNQDCELKYN